MEEFKKKSAADGDKEIVFSKAIKAGKRIYYLDVKKNRKEAFLWYKKAFEKMLANDDIYLGAYTGNYCVSCETFFTKSQLAEGDTCPDCGKPTKLVSEESYFLNLKKS